MKNSRTYFRLHAIQRIFERQISLKRVSLTIRAGETIEDYSSEMPQPGRLILGFQGQRPIHVVVSESSEKGDITVITVYLPDPDRWDSKFRKRRS